MEWWWVSQVSCRVCWFWSYSFVGFMAMSKVRNFYAFRDVGLHVQTWNCWTLTLYVILLESLACVVLLINYWAGFCTVDCATCNRCVERTALQQRPATPFRAATSIPLTTVVTSFSPGPVPVAELAYSAPVVLERDPSLAISVADEGESAVVLSMHNLPELSKVASRPEVASLQSRQPMIPMSCTVLLPLLVVLMDCKLWDLFFLLFNSIPMKAMQIMIYIAYLLGDPRDRK